MVIELIFPRSDGFAANTDQNQITEKHVTLNLDLSKSQLEITLLEKAQERDIWVSSQCTAMCYNRQAEATF